MLKGGLLKKSENEACALGNDWMPVRRHGEGVMVICISGTGPRLAPFFSADGSQLRK